MDPERVSNGNQQEECQRLRDNRWSRRACAASERVGGATSTRRLVAGGAAGAIEKILGRAGVARAGIEGVSAGGMRVAKRQQVVEEGLC